MYFEVNSSEPLSINTMQEDAKFCRRILNHFPGKTMQTLKRSKKFLGLL